MRAMITRRQSNFNEETLAALFKEGVSDQLAFLAAKSNARTLAETLAAMANANGGLAVLGVTSTGLPQKSIDTKSLQQMVAESGLLSDPPLILPSAQVVPFRESEIVVVEVPAGLPQVYSLQGSYLTRTAGQNRPLTTPELRRLLLDRGDRGYESQQVEGATLADLDNGKINRYLDHIAAPPDAEQVQSLQARGCVVAVSASEKVPTVAGLLLFGRDPYRFIRSAEIICVRYAGNSMSDEFVRQDINGTLPEQLRQAEAFVTANMRRGMRITGLSRQDSTEYPIPVVREAIVNAVAHRDYSIRGEGIRLLMFADRLEVYSPGRLPGHVTLANLKEERYSRNEAIVAILSDLGYIERLGYGIDRMIAAMNEAGLPDPKFEETSAGFRVTLYSAGNDLISTQPQTERWHHGFLNERQEMAMAFLREKGRIANIDYQGLVPDVSEETIRRDLADLVEKNLLIRIGAKKATYYILK